MSGETAELRRLAQEATPGPWRAGIGKFGVGALSAERKSLLLAEVRPDGHRLGHRDSLYAERHEDAAYIAAASPDVVLRLLDALDAGEALASEEDLRGRLHDAICDHEHGVAANPDHWRCSVGARAALVTPIPADSGWSEADIPVPDLEPWEADKPAGDLLDELKAARDHDRGLIDGVTRSSAMATWSEAISIAERHAATLATPALDVERLRAAIYEISQRHDWEHTTDREDRTEEIAAEYARVATSNPGAAT